MRDTASIVDAEHENKNRYLAWPVQMNQSSEQFGSAYSA